MALVIDLNADIGEERGDDIALLEIVTSANVAAGGHAGGGHVLDGTVRQAAVLGVGVGAHPSYLDRSGFGRVSHAHSLTDARLASTLIEQILGVAASCAASGTVITHVKAHGALYGDAAVDERVAGILLAAVVDAQSHLGLDVMPVVGMPGSALSRLASQVGVTFIAEAFADRAYRADGTLVPRSAPGAVLHETERICRQAVMIATRSMVVTARGDEVPAPAQTICLHGDTPGAVGHARAIRAALEAAGVRIAPWSLPGSA